MTTRVTVLLVLALAALALAACAPAPQAAPTAQIPPAQSEPTTAPGAEEPTMETNSNPLAGTSWILKELDGAAPAEGGRDQANLEFLADGSIAGTTGCNRYFGPFSVDGETITTGQLGSTMMACAEPLMAQEQTFLAILGSAASYTLADDTLTITAADGRTIAFTRA